jgi:uncharacterized protein (TIGR02391 family)
MYDWFVDIKKRLREIGEYSRRALRLWIADAYVFRGSLGDIGELGVALQSTWVRYGLPPERVEVLCMHLRYASSKDDLNEILDRDIPALDEFLESTLLERLQDNQAVAATPAAHRDAPALLHAVVIEHALPHLQQGHFRDAVLNAVTAVFDLIRERTGLSIDGAQLVAAAFSLEKPLLLIADLNNESGRNEQKGFIQVLQGVYSGVRNARAHSLKHDLNRTTAMQYLVLASLLASRIEAAAQVAGA